MDLRAASFFQAISSYDGASTGIFPEVEVSELLPILTLNHEYEHHRIIASTSFGLAVWRAFQALRTDLEYLFSSGHPTVFGDFENVVFPRAAAFDHALRSDRLNHSNYEEMVAWEIVVLRRFLIAMLNDRSITKGEFCGLVNLVESIVAKRSGISTKRSLVVDRGEESDPLVGEDELTPLEIMEATATLTEEAMLVSRQIPSAVITAWRSASLHGIYERSHAFFRSHFGYARFGKLVADLSFWGPVDIASRSGVIPVEDYFPTCRISRLREATRGTLLPGEIYLPNDGVIPFDKELFGGGVRATLESLLSNDLWNDNFIAARARVRGEEATDLPPETEEMIRAETSAQAAYSLLRETLYKLSLRDRLTSFSRSLMNAPESKILFEPLATVYAGGTIQMIDLDQLSQYPGLDDSTRERIVAMTEEEETKFKALVLSDFVKNCAVKSAVLGAQPPEIITSQDVFAAGGVNPLRSLYKSYFEPS